MKRVEEIVKPENRYIYKQEKDFLPWLVDHKKMMEALPPELEEDMLMSYIARTNMLTSFKLSVQLRPALIITCQPDLSCKVSWSTE